VPYRKIMNDELDRFGRKLSQRNPVTLLSFTLTDGLRQENRRNTARALPLRKPAPYPL
jgi:hypothetical protein